MIHPNTELRLVNETIGFGVFATSFIPKGTMTYVKDSLEVEVYPSKYKKMSPSLKTVVDKYSYIDEQGRRILSWDHAKYVNHCCNCNTMSTGWGFEIAIRDIYPGEEITDEYGLFNLEEEFNLYCEHPGCRKILTPNDLDIYCDVWDEKILGALQNYSAIEQPLLAYLEKKTAKELLLYCNGKIPYRSVRCLKYIPVMGNNMAISPN